MDVYKMEWLEWTVDGRSYTRTVEGCAEDLFDYRVYLERVGLAPSMPTLCTRMTHDSPAA